MKTFYLLPAFALLSLFSKGQNYPGEPMFVPYDPVFMTYNVSDLFNNYQHHVQKVLGKDNSIQGSPYVFDDFTPGIIYSKKEKAAFHLDLNINAFTNQFEFIHEEVVFSMPNFAFDSVVINHMRFIPVSIVEEDKVKIFSMQVLASDTLGNYLLKKHITGFIDKKQAGPYQQAVPAHFKKFPPGYFIYTSKNELIPLEKLNSLERFVYIPDDLNSFIKKNKIKKRDEDDLKVLFKHIFPGAVI